MTNERIMLVVAWANLLTGVRMLARDPQLAGHPSVEAAQDALAQLWLGLGYTNNEGTELGIHDLLDAEYLRAWPDDAKPYAVCHSEPISVTMGFSAPYFAARATSRTDGGAWWYPVPELAAAMLSATLGRPFHPEAISLVP